MKITSEMKPQINKLYNTGLTYKDLADKYNVTIPTIQRYVVDPRKKGVNKGTRLKVTEEKEKQIKFLYQSGKTLKAIAEELDVSITTISIYLSRAWQ